MPDYEYHRIKELAERLDEAGIDQGMIDEIMEGGEEIRRGTKPEKMAEWMRGAMIRMNRLLDKGTRNAVREACACCLGGKRLKTVRQIAMENGTLEDRIQAANQARHVFGHSVTRMKNGEVLVRFSPEGLDQYRCVCLPKAEKPLPITYCYCCGGHAKHHLQIALGRDLDCTVRSSALSSGGRRPCTFSFSIREATG
jgi:hypothetical protein